MRKFILIFCLCVLFGVGICIFSNVVNRGHERLSEFTVEKWEKYPEKRIEMIESFESKYPITTIKKENILDILGKKGLSKTENMYSYYIGNENLGGNYYAFIFNEQGICIERTIYVD